MTATRSLRPFAFADSHRARPLVNVRRSQGQRFEDSEAGTSHQRDEGAVAHGQRTAPGDRVNKRLRLVGREWLCGVLPPAFAGLGIWPQFRLLGTLSHSVPIWKAASRKKHAARKACQVERGGRGAVCSGT